MVVYSDGPGDIFVKWRTLADWIHPKFGAVFKCMMCFPMWVGMIISVVNLFLLPELNLTPFNCVIGSLSELSVFGRVIGYSFVILLDGAIASGTSWFIHNIEEYYESNSKFE